MDRMDKMDQGIEHRGIELVESQTPEDKGPGVTASRVFANDEAVLARFGKRQQLRVSPPMQPSIDAVKHLALR